MSLRGKYSFDGKWHIFLVKKKCQNVLFFFALNCVFFLKFVCLFWVVFGLAARMLFKGCPAARCHLFRFQWPAFLNDTLTQKCKWEYLRLWMGLIKKNPLLSLFMTRLSQPLHLGNLHSFTRRKSSRSS